MKNNFIWTLALAPFLQLLSLLSIFFSHHPICFVLISVNVNSFVLTITALDDNINTNDIPYQLIIVKKLSKTDQIHKTCLKKERKVLHKSYQLDQLFYFLTMISWFKLSFLLFRLWLSSGSKFRIMSRLSSQVLKPCFLLLMIQEEIRIKTLFTFAHIKISISCKRKISSKV